MNYITLTYPQTASIQFEGYMFDHVSQVFLSSGNSFIFPTLCAVNSFTNNHKVSALFPSFSGYPLPSSYYYSTDKNHLYVSIPSFDISCTLDVIIYNDAGYGTLSKKGYLITNIASSTINDLTTIAGNLIITIQDPLSEITLINH